MADAVADRSARVLVFIHIPKTGGTTLIRSVLSLNEPEKRVTPLGNIFKGGGGTSKDLGRRLRNGERPNLGGTRVVTGHLPLGIREYLPQCFPRVHDLRYFTFLREPVDRTLSHYFQVQVRESTKGTYELPPLPPEATLEDALDGGYIHDNLQTRMLSGLPEPFGEVTDAMLEQAKLNLRDRVDFFGLTERFDESLVLAKWRLGFRTVLYDSSDRGGRVNLTRPRGDEVPEQIVEAAERSNRYDIELYRHAQELFDSVPERQTLEFAVELAALRAARAEGDIELAAPLPAAYGGGAKEWRMLVEARAKLLRFEQESALRRGRDSASRAPATGQGEAQENELKAARSRVKDLERQVKRLEDGRVRARALSDERLKEARLKVRELEQDVERLKVADRARPRRVGKRSGAKPTGSRSTSDSKPAGAKPARRTRATKRAREQPARSSAKRDARQRRRATGERAPRGRAGPDQEAGSEGG